MELLLVDGPRRSLNRYPAVPMLKEHLAHDGVVMLDDADRATEQETVELWARLLGVKFEVYKRLALAVGRLGGGYTLRP